MPYYRPQCIEKLMEGAGFMIVVSRQIRDMIYTVTGKEGSLED